MRVSGYEVSPRGIDADGHVAATMHCPVGVDAERVARDMLVLFISLSRRTLTVS